MLKLECKVHRSPKMGIQKVNNTAYHQQTDGLVERVNQTVIDISTTTESGEEDWDLQLPFILFAYRATPQASTGESPLCQLYGRDRRLPNEAALSSPMEHSPVSHCWPFALHDYKSLADYQKSKPEHL